MKKPEKIKSYTANISPIMLVEDSEATIRLFEIAIQELEIPNQLIVCNNGEEALKYLKSKIEMPFVIISDQDMPKMTGIELKQEIEKDEILRMLGIPFVF